MPISRVQKTIASPLLIINVLPETSSILAVFDILYRGEVGLAPLDTTFLGLKRGPPTLSPRNRGPPPTL
jgi:hypothetical protein